MANTKITNPELFNLGDSTSATQLPVMTTTERIAMSPATIFNVDYLVVAGGGGGGASSTNYYSGGGGGAGGYRTSFGTGNINGGLTAVETSQYLSSGTSYTVTVGAGGSGGLAYSNQGSDGSNSSFSSITSIGGGGGGAGNSTSGGVSTGYGRTGGSGGGGGINKNATRTGGSAATNPVSGFGGGSSLHPASYSGGGGGAGQIGQTGSGNNSGDGGDGIQSSINGTSTYYAGGGGGAIYNDTLPDSGGSGGQGGGGAGSNGGTSGTNGTDNKGGGGGGAQRSTSAGGNGNAASGGSGVVILRYPTADIASYTATGLTPTETTDGTDTILSFTDVGTGTVAFTSSTPTGTISTGETIFNSDTDKVEYFDGTKWYGINYEVPVVPTQMYLDASNTTSYPGTGSTWFDLSGNNNNATFSGSTAPSWNANGYFNFDGSNDIMTVSGFYGFPVQTWSIWVNPDVLERACFMQTYPSGTIPAGAMYIEMSNTSGNVEAGVRTNSSSTSSVTSTATLTTAAWTHVAVTSDGSNIKIYIGNASPVSNTAVVSSLGSNNQPLVLGYEPRNVRLWFNGQVSKVRAYNVALTQAEIDVLVAEGSGAS